MKTLLASFAAVIAPLTLFALPNYDPFANATGSGGTAYGIGTWLSQNDSAVVGTGQKDATAGQWYHAEAAVCNTGQTFTSSDNIFIVVSYEVKAGNTTDDVVSLWVNPNPTTFGNNANRPAATLTTGAGSTDFVTVAGSSIRSFLLGNK